MIFLHPWMIVVGGLAATVPVIVHLLFRRRRESIDWGAMRFLIEAYQKMKRRLQIERWLLLIVRCLLLMMLGLALARPILSGTDIWAPTAGGRTVYILIDNGAISSVEDDIGQTALEKHKETARNVIKSLDSGDRVNVCLASQPPEFLFNVPTQDHVDIRRRINEIKASETPTNVPQAFGLLTEQLNSQTQINPVVVYLLSDFMLGSIDMTEKLTNVQTDMRVFIPRPYPQTINNVQITDVQLQRSVLLTGSDDLANHVQVHLRRFGSSLTQSINTVRITTQGDRGLESWWAKEVRWSDGQAETTMSVPINLSAISSREHTLIIQIDRDQLPLDDHRLAVVGLRDSFRVIILDQEEFGLSGRFDEYPAGAWIRRAINPGEGPHWNISTQNPGSLNRGSLDETDAVILTRPDLMNRENWKVLQEYIDKGGFLWLIPAGSQKIALWTDMMQEIFGVPWRLAREVEQPEADNEPLAWSMHDQQPVTDMLSLLAPQLPALLAPIEVYQRLPIIEGAEPESIVLRMEDGTPFLNRFSPAWENAGTVVYSSVTPRLDWTNIPTKPLMVALTQEVVRQCIGLSVQQKMVTVGDQLNDQNTSGTGASIETPTGERIHLTTGNNRGIFTQTGQYRIIDTTTQPLTVLIANINPNSTQTIAQSESTIEDWLSSTGWEWTFFDTNELDNTTITNVTTSEVSQYLLWLVVLLLIIEVWLARRFSHANRNDLNDTTPPLHSEAT